MTHNLIPRKLSTPKFPELAHQIQTTHLLRSTLRLLITLLLFMLIGLWVGGNLSRIDLAVILSDMALFIGLYFFLRRGYIKAVARVIIFITIVSVTLVLAFDGTIRAITTIFYVCSCVLAGIILGRREAYITTGVVALLVTGLVIAEMNQLLPPPDYTVTVAQPVIFIATLVFTLYLVNQALVTREGALERLQAELSERKKIEAELQESEQRFRIISSVTSDYTFASLLDADGKLTHTLLTGAFESITGYTPDEFVAMGGWRSTVHPDDIAIDDRLFATLNHNERAIGELRIIKKNGDVRWVRLYTHPMWDDDNNRLSGIYGGVKDFTEQKQAEQIQTVLFEISRARAETADLPELLKFTHEQIKKLMKADNFYVALYQQETEMYAFPYGVDEKDIDWSGDALQGSLTDYVFRTGKSLIVTQEVHARLHTEEGVGYVGHYSPVWIGAPLKTSKRTIGVVALQDYEKSDTYSQQDLDVLTHISENLAWVIESKMQEDAIRTLNEELERRVHERTQELEQSNRELNAFAYSVSHDLRAPLRAIVGFSTILNDDYSETLDADGQHYLERIVAGGKRMSDLIDDMLHLSRITRADIQHTTVDLSAMVTSVCETLSSQQPDHPITFKVMPDVEVEADERLMRIALENLLGNAWKFTRTTDNPRVEFIVTEEDGCTVYKICDNGVGFDMAHAEKLFGAFQRLHSANEFEGTGIGLATVQRIIHKHGGEIWVKAVVNTGATFCFTLNQIPLRSG